jgi:SM-20-related protein
MTLLAQHDLIRTPALGEVDVFDDLVPETLRRDILRMVRRPIWAYGWKSVKEHDRYGFWHAHFAGGDEASRDDCEAALAANAGAAPINALWQLLSGTILKGHVPLRVYANGHTYGVEGYVHTDSEADDYFTTIYYAHGVWDANWAGETVFLAGDPGDIVRAVLPAPGRLVMFCGATPHAARGVSRECPELRISVVIKTRLR